MNERIKELAEQAGFDYVEINDPYGYGNGELEKFAQLIVQECLNKISGLVIPEEAIQPIGPYEKWNQALGHAALEIEQHFYGDAHE